MPTQEASETHTGEKPMFWAFWDCGTITNYCCQEALNQ